METEQLAKIKDIREANLGGSSIEAIGSVELIATLYELEEDPVVKEVCREKLQELLLFMVDRIDWEKVESEKKIDKKS